MAIRVSDSATRKKDKKMTCGMLKHPRYTTSLLLTEPTQLFASSIRYLVMSATSNSTCTHECLPSNNGDNKKQGPKSGGVDGGDAGCKQTADIADLLLSLARRKLLHAFCLPILYHNTEHGRSQYRFSADATMERAFRHVHSPRWYYCPRRWAMVYSTA